MQTTLSQLIAEASWSERVEAILRKCVHCGFCTATCPTYMITGSELDSPRGRIYLIKQVLEGAKTTELTQFHLDRCLTCRACESTCPSGVNYSELLEVGRQQVDLQVGRRGMDRLVRWLLRTIIPRGRLLKFFLTPFRLVMPVLPPVMTARLPLERSRGNWPSKTHPRRMLILEGCAQFALAPDINGAAARLLDRYDITPVVAPGAGCCGALERHLDAKTASLDAMRRNIDAWWPHLQSGAEALCMTASGCGVTVKEYGRLLADDPSYAKKAKQISELTFDLAEIMDREEEELKVGDQVKPLRVAVHNPCTMRHGQKLEGIVERLVERLGHTVVRVDDPHLCCGSAGTYSILQPQLSKNLGEDRGAALKADSPDLIVTANIGCLLQLKKYSDLPVRHWADLVDEGTV